LKQRQTSKSDKYLKTHSSIYRLNAVADNVLCHKYPTIAVMPAFSEFQYLPDTLESIANALEKTDTDSVLIIIVVNNPNVKQCSPAKFADNQQTLKWLQAGNFPARLHSSLAWIDASSPGMEIKNGSGVGAARKAGMDTALSFCDWEKKPLILCLDGDTIVENNYFTAVREFYSENPAKFAAVVDFHHQKGETAEEEKAIRLYESYMVDYVEKLRTSQSPYAYHAIGSTITCRAEAYIKAGGMRPKKAGEDFYFLQALRKLSPDASIGEITQTVLHPSARASDRVPFGTGARIIELLSDSTTEFPGRYLYNPNIFADLTILLTSVNNGTFLHSDETSFDSIPDTVTAFLDSCEFRRIWPKIRKNTPNDPDKIKWAFHTWFDAFRTLKFIHFCELRNPEKYGRIPNTI